MKNLQYSCIPICFKGLGQFSQARYKLVVISGKLVRETLTVRGDVGASGNDQAYAAYPDAVIMDLLIGPLLDQAVIGAIARRFFSVIPLGGVKGENNSV